VGGVFEKTVLLYYNGRGTSTSVHNTSDNWVNADTVIISHDSWCRLASAGETSGDEFVKRRAFPPLEICPPLVRVRVKGGLQHINFTELN